MISTILLVALLSCLIYYVVLSGIFCGRLDEAAAEVMHSSGLFIDVCTSRILNNMQASVIQDPLVEAKEIKTTINSDFV